MRSSLCSRRCWRCPRTTRRILTPTLVGGASSSSTPASSRRRGRSSDTRTSTTTEEAHYPNPGAARGVDPADFTAGAGLATIPCVIELTNLVLQHRAKCDGTLCFRPSLCGFNGVVMSLGGQCNVCDQYVRWYSSPKLNAGDLEPEATPTTPANANDDGADDISPNPMRLYHNELVSFACSSTAGVFEQQCCLFEAMELKLPHKDTVNRKMHGPCADAIAATWEDEVDGLIDDAKDNQDGRMLLAFDGSHSGTADGKAPSRPATGSTLSLAKRSGLRHRMTAPPPRASTGSANGCSTGTTLVPQHSEARGIHYPPSGGIAQDDGQLFVPWPLPKQSIPFASRLLTDDVEDEDEDSSEEESEEENDRASSISVRRSRRVAGGGGAGASGASGAGASGVSSSSGRPSSQSGRQGAARGLARAATAAASTSGRRTTRSRG